MAARIARFAVLVTVLGAALAAPAGATILSFRSELSQAGHPSYFLFPPGGTGSSATGLLTFDYDTTTHEAFNIRFDIVGLSFAELLVGAPNQAHIHPPGLGFHIINLSELGFVDVPGGVTLSSSGPAAASVPIVASLLAGEAWVNVHTNAFPNGEIAGIVHLVPEPGAITLWVAGFGWVTFRRRSSPPSG